MDSLLTLKIAVPEYCFINLSLGSVMQTNTAAKCLAELGHETRLNIFRFLVRKGHQGVPVGDIQAELDVPGSTLSHHITRLVSVGLVIQRREGRTLYCVPQFDQLESLISFMQEECCADE